MRNWIKCVMVVSGAMALLGSTRGAAAATVIDFNAIGDGLSTYTEAGVTFTAIDLGTFGGFTGPNGTKGLLSDNTVVYSMLRADIAGGATSVSVDLGDFDADADTLTLQAFDSANNSLGLVTFLFAAATTGMQTLTVSDPAIDHVVFGSTAPSVGGSTVFADNFTFTPGLAAPAVPLPNAAWGGMALLGALAVVRRWRAV